jgi:hypothetical protein
MVAGWQTPSPLQVRPEIAVAWPSGQDGPAHAVVASYRRQAPLPSHFPSVPQLVEP